jgi:hypothetical protein
VDANLREKMLPSDMAGERNKTAAFSSTDKRTPAMISLSTYMDSDPQGI